MRFIIFFILTSIAYSDNEVCFEVTANPYPNVQALSCFTKYINVLGCFEIFAESSIQDDKVLHAAAIAAELLDNNEDGIVDDQEIYHRLQLRGALMPIFSYDGNPCMDNFEQYYNGSGVSAVLYRNEIDPSNPGQWGDDASVEEILHTINHVGHVSLYPNFFNILPNSSIMSEAMDIARGGQFLSVPSSYPDQAWYHYDDWTCDYECMAIEYMYWAIVSNMGILDDPQTCSGIYNEWELCTQDLFSTTDITMYNLITDPQHKIPQLPPDGNYCPFTGVLGDINTDDSIDILDVVLVVGIILGQEELSLSADMNTDSLVNIQDIILLVNLILAP